MAIPLIRVEVLNLEEVSLHVIDHFTSKVWHARLKIDLHIEDFQLGDLSKQDIQVDRLQFELHDLTVDQPEGFSHTPILSLDRLTLATTGINLANPRLTIDELVLENLTASVERDADGMVNLQRMMDAWLPSTAGYFPNPSKGTKIKISVFLACLLRS